MAKYMQKSLDPYKKSLDPYIRELPPNAKRIEKSPRIALDSEDNPYEPRSGTDIYELPDGRRIAWHWTLFTGPNGSSQDRGEYID